MKDILIYNPNLHNSLLHGKLNGVNQNIYLISFRLLKKDSNVVVYNYVSYPVCFSYSLLAFLIGKENFRQTSLFKDWGDFLTLIDNSIGCDPSINNIKIRANEFNTHFLDYRDSNYYPDRIEDAFTLFDVLKKLVFIRSSDSLTKLLDTIIRKDYKSFFTHIFENLSRTLTLIDKIDLKSDTYLLKDCLFVVKDIKPILEGLKSMGYIVNKGPKSSRDQLNSMASFLSCLDTEYRQFLYNYHSNLLETNRLPSYAKLSRSKFSFRNIHNNIGNVKWYSTSTQTNTRHTSIVSNRQQLFENNYLLIKDILDSNGNTSPYEIQLEIEKTLSQQEDIFINSNNIKNKFNFNIKTYDLLVEKQDQLIKLLSYPEGVNLKITTQSSTYIPLVNKIIKYLGPKFVSNLLLSYYMEILSKETGKVNDVESPGISSTDSFSTFGEKIFNKYMYQLYIKSDLYADKGSLSQFKHSVKDQYSEIYNEDSSYALLGGYFVISLVTVGLLEQVLDRDPSNSKETLWYIRIPLDVRNIFITNNIKVYGIPQRLPMVCEPKNFVYSTNVKNSKLGGYLLNDTSYTINLIKDRIGYAKQTKLSKGNITVSLVNGLGKTPYKINIDTLEYIYRYGIEKNIIIDDSSSDIVSFIKNPYKNRTKADSIKYRSIFSKILMERNILSIADTYSNVEKIYFPVRLDFRTRIYCQTEYFDYQKSDLAKGLIQFFNPGKINKYDNEVIKYLKAYGANMFGLNLDKKSLNYRAKWVDENSNYILDFENNDIIDKAENKPCFISFCFEYKRFIEFMNDKDSTIFYTYLPIQLDATCNGYQHLALLTKETKLLSKLNLGASSFDDDPNDYYTFIWDKTKSFIDKEIKSLSEQKLSESKEKEYLSLIKMQKIDLGRPVIKKILMKESYSAGLLTLVKNVIEDESVTIVGLKDVDKNSSSDNKLTKTYLYKYKDIDIQFDRSDVFTYIKTLKRVSNMVAPKIKELSTYLDNIVSICTKLSIPVPWRTPSGADIEGSYLVEKDRKIAAFSFTKTRFTFKKYINGKYDLNKQKRGIRPNLIHSLDAATIAMLYNTLHNVDLYTIHDCFAVTANNVPLLLNKLKIVYIRLYSDEGYLLEFDRAVRININNMYGEKVFNVNDKYINIPNGSKYKKVLFPDITKVVSVNDNGIDVLKGSSYVLV